MGTAKLQIQHILADGVIDAHRRECDMLGRFGPNRIQRHARRQGRIMVNKPRTAGEASKPTGVSGINADEFVALRKDMLRFAEIQLRDRDIAEDMVQEAVEAALRSAAAFTGQSSLKTWVFAILKNKISDHLRRQHRTVTISSLLEEDEEWDQKLEALFNDSGRWRAEMRPASWPDPEQSLSNKQFWRIFEACLDHLPTNTARVFMMREFLGFEPGEICAQLSLTTSNCHVILHRARFRLRSCLETGWGTAGEHSC